MIILEIIFVILININIAKCQQSCSDFANYYADYYGTYGQVEIPDVPLQQNLFFEIELSLAARLPSVNNNLINMISLSDFYLIKFRATTGKLSHLIKTYTMIC